MKNCYNNPKMAEYLRDEQLVREFINNREANIASFRRAAITAIWSFALLIVFFLMALFAPLMISENSPNVVKNETFRTK